MNSAITKVKKAILQPYKRQHIPIIALTYVLFIAITFLTVNMLQNEDTNYQSHAQSSNSIEPENGVVSGSVTVANDANASGGKYIKFGSINLTPTVIPTSPPTSSSGIWISHNEIMVLPMSGAAWNAMFAIAEGNLGTANVSDQDSNHDSNTMAAALVAARTGRADMRSKAVAAIVSAIDTEAGGRWLAVGRNVGAYVIAADVLNLRDDGNPNSDGSRVQAWVGRFLTRTLQDNNDPLTQRTLREVSWTSGSNASTQQGFVHAAVAAYLGNKAELAWGWDGYRRYAGDRTSSHTQTSNDLSWQFIPSDPVGIQDFGATKNGCRLDGAVGNDMSRGGGFSCTPGYTQYPWVGLEGGVPAALVFYRAGYPSFEIMNQAIKRAFDYLWYVRTVTGNTAWFDGSRANEIIFLVNRAYGASYLISLPTGGGRTVGYTDWTHANWTPGI